MIALADTSVLLADSSKFGVKAVEFFAKPTDVDMIVTDAGADSRMIAKLVRAGVRVDVVHDESEAPPQPESLVRVALFITCLTDAYFPRTGIAAVKVLEHLGHNVEFPRSQTCCGQPIFNNGFTSDARGLASRMIDVFEPYEAVVTPSGSCAAMIREHYVHLFDGDPDASARAARLAARTFEFCEFLSRVLGVDLRQLGVRWEGAATLHSACHLRTLGLTGVAEDLLTQVRGLDLVPLAKADQCCGFGGTFSVKYPQISGPMVADKMSAIVASGCGSVVCNEAGCGMNLAGACRRAGIPARFVSVAEIIAEGLGLLDRPENPA